MNLALRLIVLSLLGAEGPAGRDPGDQVVHKVTALSAVAAESPPNSSGPAITYNVCVFRISGLEWRGTFHSQLQPVGGRAGGSVWTASRETAERLAELDPNGWKAPQITAASQGWAHLSDRTNRKFTSMVTRLADGPVDHATRVAYTPQYEDVRDGFALTMTGRKLDQGVLACVVLDESRVATVHQVALSENVATKACCASDTDSCPASGKITARIEVPEVVHASLAGEWLIPNDGVLVVSLGVQTTADSAGKAVVAERLMLIDAAAVAQQCVEQAVLALPLPNLANKPLGPTGAAGVPIPMPAMPSRCLPQALNADGSPMALPPLPEERATPSSLPGSSEPCASPQGSQRKSPEPTTLDTASARAAFTPAPAPKGKTAEAEASDTARPYLFRFPVNAGGMNMEVDVRMASPFSFLEKLRSPKTPQPAR
jgi:hypothetical protein